MAPRAGIEPTTHCLEDIEASLDRLGIGPFARKSAVAEIAAGEKIASFFVPGLAIGICQAIVKAFGLNNQESRTSDRPVNRPGADPVKTAAL